MINRGPQNPVGFLINLGLGDKLEPRIESKQFLESLSKFGVWLRVINAWSSIRMLKAGGSDVERWAALSNLYLQLGAQLEDLAVGLVALSAWSKDRTLSLPDILSSLWIRRGGTHSAEGYISDVHSKIHEQRKRVTVDVATFFNECRTRDPKDLVETFVGYKWRPKPSIRLVPPNRQTLWSTFPKALQEICTFYSDPKVDLVASVFNKIKHGPQIVIQDIADAIAARGTQQPLVQSGTRTRNSENAVRVLFDGSRTQEQPGEYETGNRVAPFLLGNSSYYEKIFYGTMVHYANLYFHLAEMQRALLMNNRVEEPDFDPIVREILQAQARYLSSGSKK